RAVVAVIERAVDDVDRQRRIVEVGAEGGGARAAEVEDRVGVAAGGDRNRAGAGEAVIRGEGRGVDQRVRRGGQAADGAVGRGDVGGLEANRRLAEGEGDNRAVVAVIERAVDDVDRQRRIV